MKQITVTNNTNEKINLVLQTKTIDGEIYYDMKEHANLNPGQVKTFTFIVGDADSAEIKIGNFTWFIDSENIFIEGYGNNYQLNDINNKPMKLLSSDNNYFMATMLFLLFF